MSPRNHGILTDVADLREVLPRPDGRNYTLLAKADHIRVKFDDCVAVANHDHLYSDIEARGYRFTGVGFDSHTLVFEPEVVDR